MGYTGEKGTKGVAGTFQYCPVCGGKNLYLNIIYSNVDGSTNFNFGSMQKINCRHCSWLGVKSQLLTETQKLSFDRREKLKTLQK